MLFLEGCVRRGLGIKEHLKLKLGLKAVRLADCFEVERRGVRREADWNEREDEALDEPVRRLLARP